MTSTADHRSDKDSCGVCSVCGRSLADNTIPHSDRCDTHHRYHPPDPPAPPLGLTDDEEAEHCCSASLSQITILTRAIRVERRRTYAA
jgi:hypothetical protein